jgi:hypothetical protein
MARFSAVAFLSLLSLWLTIAVAFESEIISDLVTTGTDERRALEAKAEQFWQPVLDAAQATQMDVYSGKHLAVYSEVESAIAELPSENQHVRDLLSEALMRLKRADDKVFEQAVESTNVASEKLHNGPGNFDNVFSFMTGGQNWLASTMRRFVGSGRYSEKLEKHVSNRQGDILPPLRGISKIAGNVLTDCRLSSKLSFDVMKYDIYNDGVPKTPKAAKDAADRLVIASSETRKHFMAGTMAAVKSITKDVEGKTEDASSTVTASLLASMQPVQHSCASELEIGAQIVFN